MHSLGLDQPETDRLDGFLATAYDALVASNPLPASMKDRVVALLAGEGVDHLPPPAPQETLLLKLAPSWLESTPDARRRQELFAKAAGASLGAWLQVLSYAAARRVAASAKGVAA